MKVIQALDELPFVEAQAIIINCGTKWVTTLALASALKNSGMPVLLIDCESKDGSHGHFQQIADRYGWSFHWLSWPLRPHSDALDEIFRKIPASTVLLVDSDAEIRAPDLVNAMRSGLNSHHQNYGAGFLQPAGWLEPPAHLLPKKTGYSAERMWIPVSLLRVDLIRIALNNGASFKTRRPFFEIRDHTKLSRLIGYRFRIPGLRKLEFPGFQHSGRSDDLRVEGIRPAFMDFDTGADLHRHLVSAGYSYHVVSDSLWSHVHHFHGVTRAALGGSLRRRIYIRLGMISDQTNTLGSSTLAQALSRLRDEYGIDS